MTERLDAEIAALTKWCEQLTEWRSLLCERLLACPRRSLEAPGLKRAIGRIDRDLDPLPTTPLDDLLAEAGCQPSDWLGCLPRAERRLAELLRIRETAAKLASSDQDSTRVVSAGVLRS